MSLKESRLLESLANPQNSFLEDRVFKFSSINIQLIEQFGFKRTNVFKIIDDWTTIHRPQDSIWSEILGITLENYEDIYGFWVISRMAPESNDPKFTHFCIERDPNFRDNYADTPRQKEESIFYLAIANNEEINALISDLI